MMPTFMVPVARFVRATGRESWWILRGAARIAARRKKSALLISMGCLYLWQTSEWLMLASALAVAATCTLRCRLKPESFIRHISLPLWRRRKTRVLMKRWPDIALACGLGRVTQRREWFWQQRVIAVRQIPALSRARWHDLTLTVLVRPMIGQTVESIATVAEELRHALDAERIKVSPVGRSALVEFSYGDGLSQIFPCVVPALNASVPSGHVHMGQREDGSAWRLPIGPQTLVAGSPGAGKASLIWSFVFGIAPGIRNGEIALLGIDLKGGMELSMGSALFTELATTPEGAVELLEMAARAMTERALRLGGVTRQHARSVNDPFVVIVIDELAALTAYLSDRKLRSRAESALSLICSQGRALGFMVFACLQDPRKEVLPVRGLFTQTIALRLADALETTMVLGAGANEAGARCHQIPRTRPGVGYVVPEGGGFPEKVRAGFVSDESITIASARFAPLIRPNIDLSAREAESPVK